MVVNFETTRVRFFFQKTPAKVLCQLNVTKTSFISRTMAAVGELGEVNSVSDLERKLAEIHIPWDEIAPAHIHE